VENKLDIEGILDPSQKLKKVASKLAQTAYEELKDFIAKVIAYSNG
jgi:hypothetical protein